MWTIIERTAALIALTSTLIWLVQMTLREVKKNAADHLKIEALWHDLGYGNWNGVDRRGPKREVWP